MYSPTGPRIISSSSPIRAQIPGIRYPNQSPLVYSTQPFHAVNLPKFSTIISTPTTEVSYPQATVSKNILDFTKDQIDRNFIAGLDFTRIATGKTSYRNPAYSVQELQIIAEKLFLRTSQSKEELVKSIRARLQQLGYNISV